MSETNDYLTLGKRIREIRIKRKLSQAEVAELANLSLPNYNRIECGKAKMYLPTFVKIAEALQISTDFLLRPDIPEVNGIYQGEFNELLSDCSPEEIESILKIVKEVKSSMRSKTEY